MALLLSEWVTSTLLILEYMTSHWLSETYPKCTINMWINNCKVWDFHIGGSFVEHPDINVYSGAVGAMPREGGSATNRWSIKQLQSYYHCTSGHIYSIQTFSYEVFLRCLILLKFSHKTLSPLILICTSCETLLKFVVKKQMGMNGVSGEALRRGFTVALEITTNFVQHQPSSL